MFIILYVDINDIIIFNCVTYYNLRRYKHSNIHMSQSPWTLIYATYQTLTQKDAQNRYYIILYNIYPHVYPFMLSEFIIITFMEYIYFFLHLNIQLILKLMCVAMFINFEQDTLFILQYTNTRVYLSDKRLLSTSAKSIRCIIVPWQEVNDEILCCAFPGESIINSIIIL